MEHSATAGQRHAPWNKGKLVGQQSPLSLEDIRAVRVRLQIANRVREFALLRCRGRCGARSAAPSPKSVIDLLPASRSVHDVADYVSSGHAENSRAISFPSVHA
jgi:hypothetical protein